VGHDVSNLRRCVWYTVGQHVACVHNLTVTAPRQRVHQVFTVAAPSTQRHIYYAQIRDHPVTTGLHTKCTKVRLTAAKSCVFPSTSSPVLVDSTEACLPTQRKRITWALSTGWCLEIYTYVYKHCFSGSGDRSGPQTRRFILLLRLHHQPMKEAHDTADLQQQRRVYRSAVMNRVTARINHICYAGMHPLRILFANDSFKYITCTGSAYLI
jgi:hypothetical protein